MGTWTFGVVWGVKLSSLESSNGLGEVMPVLCLLLSIFEGRVASIPT